MKQYRFKTRKDKNNIIYVSFAHIPGRWFSTGTTEETQAVVFAERVIRDEIGVDQKEITLNDFAKDFFSEDDPHGFRNRNKKRHVERSEGYYDDCASRLNNYILPYFGSHLLSRIKDTAIEDFILNLKSVKNPKKELDDSSKNKVLSVFRIVLQEAVREGYVDKNEAKEVQQINEIKGRRDTFSEEEVSILFPEDRDEIIRIWGSLLWATYFSILKDTGWRPGTAAALRVDHFYQKLGGSKLNGVYSDEEVSWKTHTIIHRIKTSDTKNGAKSLQGFVTDQTAALIYELSKKSSSSYIFELKSETMPKSHRKTNHDTQYIYAELANKILRSACKRVNIQLGKRTQYSFRHYFSTYHYGRMPEMARLLLMGHTKNRSEYTHLTPLQSLERVLEIEGVKEALEFDEQ